MKKNLVIVESPVKANTIQKFLGDEYNVVSSYGHIIDLPEKKIGIQIKNNFKPDYVIPYNKKKIVKNLKSLIDSYNTIWLASDEDREGEAIAYQICTFFNIPKNKYKRIVFHEITKKAIINAINNPRKINKNLVYAQQTRRILDRLVGFQLSPILWKKINNGLSAGRVQSAAVRLIVEQEEKIKNFIPSSYYQVDGYFFNKQKKLHARLYKEITNENKLKELFFSCIKDKNNFIVKKIIKSNQKKSPHRPFTTSSLQQYACNKLYFSVAKTMFLSQKLYEKGFITYIRTDSTKLSNFIIQNIEKYIISCYGQKYLSIRNTYPSKKFSQEAHEAIRPTKIKYDENYLQFLSISEKKLYKIIWERTIMSQMSDAIFEILNFYIESSSSKDIFIHTKKYILFDGFIKISNEKLKENEEYNSLKIKEGTLLKNEQIIAKQIFKKHPYRYNEASLVKNLESLGIGRPSTYVPIIYTIQKRNYVINQKAIKQTEKRIILTLKDDTINKKIENIVRTEKNRFVPTEIGVITTDFLKKNFQEIVNFNFTANLEKSFDDIAKGEINWIDIINEFYKKFYEKIKYVKKHTKKIHKEHFIGIDIKSKKKIFAKIAKFGPVLQIGEFGDEVKPKFIPLLNKQKLNRITLQKALKIIELPKSLGFFKEKEIFLNINKYNIFIKYDKKFIPIDEKIFFNYSIGLQEAIKIINNYKKSK
ncbi:type I DNA topoisomerase [Blattabacterium cuenoti]|uniref:type I DNA topoisomerase n=1 Tax=Blattabacterium cuenoti TaxID=1653831 RepID=UPI00163C37DC|nr:type I DNA topoisomerase [Blattabacterium cuenoti]